MFISKLIENVWVPGQTSEEFDEESLQSLVGANITWTTFITGLGHDLATAQEKETFL